VRPHRYGSYLVAVHSCVEILNDTSLPLQLGSLSPVSQEPALFAQLPPGGRAWLPLPLAAATTPRLCLRPMPGAAPALQPASAAATGGGPPPLTSRGGSGVSLSHAAEAEGEAGAGPPLVPPASAASAPRPAAAAPAGHHGWSRPVDVGALLVPAADAAANRAAFWYCPPAHAAPRVVSFPPAGGSSAVLGGGGSNRSSYGELHHYFPSEPILGSGGAFGGLSSGAPLHGHAGAHSLLRARAAHGSAGAFSAGSGAGSEVGSQPATPQFGVGRSPGAAAAPPLMVCLGASPLPLPPRGGGGGGGTPQAAAPSAAGLPASGPPSASPSRPQLVRDAPLPAASGPSQSPGSRSGSWLPAAPGPGGPPRLWRLRISPPLVLENELPIPIEVALGAGGRGGGGAHGEARVTDAAVMPGRRLMLYDLEPHLYHRLQVTPLGFNPTPWISLPAAAVASIHGGLEGGGSGAAGAAAGGGEEREGGRSVVVAPAQLDQPSEVIQIGWAAAPGSGALSLSVSCGLWVFNHTGMPLGLRQLPAPGGGGGSAAAPAAAAQPPLPAQAPRDVAALLAAPPGAPRGLTPAGMASSPTGSALPGPAAHLLPTAAAMVAASMAGEGAGGGGGPAGRRRALDLLTPPVLWVPPQPAPQPATADAAERRRSRGAGGQDGPHAGLARSAGGASGSLRVPSPPARGSVVAGGTRGATAISIAPPPSPATTPGSTLVGAGGLASLASAPSAGLPSPAPSATGALTLPSGLAAAPGRREPAAAAAAAAAAAVGAGRPPGGLQRRSRSLGSMVLAPGSDQGPEGGAGSGSAGATGSRAHLRLTFTDQDSPSGAPHGAASPQTPVWGAGAGGSDAAAAGGGGIGRGLLQRAPSMVSQDGSLAAASVMSAPPGGAGGGHLSSLRTRRPLSASAVAAAAAHPWPSLLGLPTRPAAAAAPAPLLELQLCAAPAALASAAARGIPTAGSGRPLSVPSSCWSQPVALQLRCLPAGPPTTAAVVRLPYPAPAAVAAAAAADGGGGAATQGVMIVSLQLRDLPHAAQQGGSGGMGGSGGGREARALHVLPTYQLLNLLPFEVQLRQAGTEQTLQARWGVAPGGQAGGRAAEVGGRQVLQGALVSGQQVSRVRSVPGHGIFRAP
jgi:hypothetical protein